MALTIRWTPEAEENFSSIIDYLEREWTEKEIRKFAQKTQKIISQIAIHPQMFKASGRDEIRKAVITRQTSLFYRVDENANVISLLAFWDNRKNPKSLKF